MKRLMKRIRMKRRASQIRSKSVDPVKAYRGHIEIGIYTWLLEMVAKELEVQEEANAQDEATVTKAMAAPAPLAAIAQAGVQAA